MGTDHFIASKEQRSGRRAISLLFFINGALIGVWASRIPAITDIHSLSPAMLGLVLLVLASGGILAFPFSGYAMDRLGAGRVTRSLAVVYLFSIILIPLAPNVLALAGALWVFGAVHGAMDVAMNGWAAKLEQGYRRPIMSSFHAVFSLGAGLGAASGYFAVSADYEILTHFSISVVLSAAGLVYIWLQDEGCDMTPRPDQKAPLFSLPKGPLLAVALIAFCSAIGEGGNGDWSALFLISSAGVDEARAAIGYAVFSAAMVVMRLLGDRLIARHGPLKMARISGIFGAIGGVVVLFAPMFELKLVGFALLGAGFAVMFPLAYSRAANDPVMPPGAALAAVATLGYGGLLLGPVVIGFLAQIFGIERAFGVMILLGIGIFMLGRSLDSIRE